LSVFTASLGLHLRLKKASDHWKTEATMVKRRSMMSMTDKPMAVVEPRTSESTLGGGTVTSTNKRWSNAPEYTLGAANGNGNGGAKTTESDEEERLESEVELARRYSKDQEGMIRRAS
jgi:hypothetical protein